MAIPIREQVVCAGSWYPIYARGFAYEALSKRELAIQDFERVMRMDPTFHPAYNELAWLMATTETPPFRDGERALQLATKACEMTGWKNYKYLETLAAAYARTGDFKHATEWEQRAMASQDA